MTTYTPINIADVAKLEKRDRATLLPGATNTKFAPMVDGHAVFIGTKLNKEQHKSKRYAPENDSVLIELMLEKDGDVISRMMLPWADWKAALGRTSNEFKNHEPEHLLCKLVYQLWGITLRDPTVLLEATHS